MTPIRHAAGAPLVIGLVNGMPGEARGRTERQFRAVLTAAATQPLELRLFALEGAAPGYADVLAVPDAGLDGMIVTGAPPRAASLPQEATWPRLAALIDHAWGADLPTVWSCLAAHAAVLHLDGIKRQRLPAKLTGLIACARTWAAHPLAIGLPDHWRAPHSRYNDLPSDRLMAAGYRVLSRAGTKGADIFVKDGGAPFLFCQGHPEYEADTLLREYRRDVGAWLEAGSGPPPVRPHGCFTPVAEAALDAFLRDASGPESMQSFPFAACAAGLTAAWQPVTARLYRSWLDEIAARRLSAGATPFPPPVTLAHADAR